ncbi:peptidoglycan hydrolase [Alcanivorax xiamenensis]|uniref:Peptidoglycan hydrolase FlgJ n=1 Tax=Alcanivorax xiamenensis TaxID=1177156 RepID=A0ABQ6Y4H3_9GAMM|nr:flagellar assembly peptidoglycan hydrolase FlgJ [Alcanivorax xiamenensis]KAF0804088.1 peptidoglycan hydrolase [Alcanivorax xiamenensis]
MAVGAGNNQFALDLQGLQRLKQKAALEPAKQLAHAAQQFEALFLQRMVKSMRDAVPRSDLLDSNQSRFYQSLADQQMAQHVAGRGVGLAEQLISQLSPRAGGGTEVPAAFGAVPRALGAKQALPVTAPDRFAGVVERQAEWSKEAFLQRLSGPAGEASERSGLPRELLLAQAALETGWGRHRIHTAEGADSHNLFGIKAGTGWRGNTTDIITHEYVDGEKVRQVDRFRVYDSYADAFADHGRLLTENPRYAGVMSAPDAHSAARALQASGYATDPAYAEKLIAVMEGLSGTSLASTTID